MKFIKVLFALVLFATIPYLSAFAQDDATSLNNIMVKTAKVYNDIPIEKVYLHFDKPYYAVGDTIWFKAYLTLDNHRPSPLSKIVYAAILGPRDSLIQLLKLQVKNSVAWGNFPLSQYSYKKGNYRVVAYTNWMDNAGPAYFFNKNITIGDAINNTVSTQVSLKSTMAGKIPKVSAAIFYKDDNGNPYAGKKVSWSVIKDDEAILKGKGETDINGFIDINFLNVKNYNLDSTTLVTAVDNGARKQINSSFSLKPISKPNDIQFFPEGGELLIGLRTKVAFKAIKPDGLGIDAKGTITDNNNNVVAEFSSSHLGMGYFSLSPEDGKTYTVKVTFADGSTATPILPKIQTGGINLGLENSNADALTIKIQADAPFFQAYKGKTFFILAKSSGLICYAAKMQLQDQAYNANIPKAKFPTGIVQVTLFSPDGDPVSERIAFIQHNDQLNLSISSDRPAYNTRQKVKLNILAKNNDQPDEGNFSLSVVDDAKVPFDENSETTILTYLLLTSDIKGYIEKPNYYFNHPDEKTAADLDVLLQTQGYRRFSYDGILGDKYPSISYLPEQGITISGTLRAANGIPVNKGNVRLSIHDKNRSENTITDADGHFKFSNVVFQDSSQLVLSARDNARSNDMVLSVDGDHSQGLAENYNAPDEIVNIDSALSSYLANSKVQYSDKHMLREVVIKDTKIVKTVTHRDFSSLQSLSHEADYTIKGSLFQGCGEPIECIKSLAAGMVFENENFYVMRDYSQGKATPAAIFLRGQFVDANALVGLNPNDIESVEIFYKDELGMIKSLYNTNGAIVVNLKKVEPAKKVTMQELRDLIPKRNEITFTPRGYTAIKAFYLPRYDGPRESQTNTTDRRSTIYWNPNVITDKTGTATLEYFNSDGRGTYRAIIEGIDKDGNIGRQVYRYTVK
ncbi:MAG TPA: carboxypeptidase regulatory-like domain-containing protein [Mucilaginibacter sp.]